MRFHVLGVGPIGGLISFHLRRSLPSHHSIALIHKTQALANSRGGAIHIENHGLISTMDGFKSEVFEGTDPVTKMTGSAAGADPIDSLFVTTKAHTTVPAIDRLLPRLTPNTTIVLMQNGMGVYEELVHRIFRNPEQRPHFILSSNSHGAFRKDTHIAHFVHAGLGCIDFGIVPDPGGRNFEASFDNTDVPRAEQQPRLSDITPGDDDPQYERYKSLRETIAALLLMEPLDVSWRPMSELQTLMRRKLVANAVINPLTALMGCRNGDIFTTQAATRIMQRVCGEASSAFQAEFRSDAMAWLEKLNVQGIDPSSLPVRRISPSLHHTSLEEEVRRIAHATRGNISSMLSDVRNGRTTEVEFLNGYLLKLGSAYRVPMPATATLLNLIKMRSAIPIDQIL